MGFQALVEAVRLEMQQVQPKNQDSKVVELGLQDMELQALMELELRELEFMEREQLEQVFQAQDSVQLMELVEVSGQIMELVQLHIKVVEVLGLPTCQERQELQELRVHPQPTQLQEVATPSSVKDMGEAKAAIAVKVPATIILESSESLIDFIVFIYYNRLGHSYSNLMEALRANYGKLVRYLNQ